MTTPNTTPSAFAPVEPVEHKPRNLVLCFDDTADLCGAYSSNVLRMLQLLRDDDITSQVVYYEPGIGPRIEPSIWSDMIDHHILLSVGKLLDNALGTYHAQHVVDGYKFLVQHYNPGDRVYIFGYSRGAYIARVVAAMLHKVGLVMQNEGENDRTSAMTSLAYDLYVSTRPGNESIASDFKRQYCNSVCIDFLGVWDTVPNKGLLRSQTPPFVNANPSICVFRQALALDECRARFCPNLFHCSAVSSETEEILKTDVKEVWFVGNNSDVGGGSLPNTESYDLANISLRWMIEQVILSGSQIKFQYENFASMKVPTIIGQDQSEGLPLASEDVNILNAHDVVQPITNNLFKISLWWVFEMIPTLYTFQNMEGKWVTTLRPHFGYGRQLPQGALFHTSVKTRMDDPALLYKPKAHYKPNTEIYVS